MRPYHSSFNTYPHRVFANAALLDGKIIDWKTGNWRWRNGQHLKPAVIRTKSFIVNNNEEHSKAFNVLAVKFYKQFPMHENFRAYRPYKEGVQK